MLLLAQAEREGSITRLTLRAINGELKRLGHDVHLDQGDIYFYFWKGEVNNWLDRTVNVAKVSGLTLEQWIGDSLLYAPAFQLRLARQVFICTYFTCKAKMARTATKQRQLKGRKPFTVTRIARRGQIGHD
jgi:hypothetical protein